jgi:signal transduction histidine kinase
MPNPSTEIISQTIAISTIFLLIVGAFATRYVFLYQRKRFIHQQELLELRESFGQILLQSKLDIQEQTLDHIAKELHANIGQYVSRIKIDLEELTMLTSDVVKEKVNETWTTAQILYAEIRALNASLNTDHIMHIGFAEALNNELTHLGKMKKYKISFTKTGQEYRLSPDDEIILFRLCQEILNNIVNHADATMVSALLLFSPEQFTLELKDNGIGFDPEAALAKSAAKNSTGLLNMRKRIKLIGGTLDIASEPGNGSAFTINIPAPSNTLLS